MRPASNTSASIASSLNIVVAGILHCAVNSRGRGWCRLVFCCVVGRDRAPSDATCPCWVNCGWANWGAQCPSWGNTGATSPRRPCCGCVNESCILCPLTLCPMKLTAFRLFESSPGLPKPGLPARCVGFSGLERPGEPKTLTRSTGANPPDGGTTFTGRMPVDACGEPVDVYGESSRVSN